MIAILAHDDLREESRCHDAVFQQRVRQRGDDRHGINDAALHILGAHRAPAKEARGFIVQPFAELPLPLPHGAALRAKAPPFGCLAPLDSCANPPAPAPRTPSVPRQSSASRAGALRNQGHQLCSHLQLHRGADRHPAPAGQFRSPIRQNPWMAVPRWPPPSITASNKRSGAAFAAASPPPAITFTALPTDTRCLRRCSTQFAKVEYLIPASRANFAPLVPHRSNSSGNASRRCADARTRPRTSCFRTSVFAFRDVTVPML